MSTDPKTKTLFFALLLSSLVFFANAKGIQAQVIFQSGFEEGNKSIWDDYDGNPDSENLIMADPGPENTPGNHVMRLRVPPGRGSSDLVKVLPSQHDQLYFRWYQKWEPGYNFSAPNHGSSLYAGSRDYLGSSDNRPNGDDFMNSHLEPLSQRLNIYSYYRGMYMDCANPQGACWGDHFPCWFDEGGICDKPEHRETIMPPLLEHNRWYCLEMMIEMGTPVQSDAAADGVQNYWLDGVQYGPFQHLWHRTTPDLKLAVLWLLLFHHDASHSVEGIMLDDVAVSTQRVGCGTTPPSDTTPPAAPSGLSVS